MSTAYVSKVTDEDLTELAGLVTVTGGEPDPDAVQNWNPGTSGAMPRKPLHVHWASGGSDVAPNRPTPGQFLALVREVQRLRRIEARYWSIVDLVEPDVGR